MQRLSQPDDQSFFVELLGLLLDYDNLLSDVQMLAYRKANFAIDAFIRARCCNSLLIIAAQTSARGCLNSATTNSEVIGGRLSFI